MAKLSAPAAARVRQVAATLLKVPASAAKPLPMPKGKAGRAPSARSQAASGKSGYAKS